MTLIGIEGMFSDRRLATMLSVILKLVILVTLRTLTVIPSSSYHLFPDEDLGEMSVTLKNTFFFFCLLQLLRKWLCSHQRNSVEILRFGRKEGR